MRELAAEMPAGVNWDRLAAEMTANIRVGLAAGECVAPRRPQTSVALRMARRRPRWPESAVLLVSAWWLNMPPPRQVALGRAIAEDRAGAALARRHSALEDRGPDGGSFRVRNSVAGERRHAGNFAGQERPVSVSVSVQGSASARYVDADTGQVTITSVYAQ